MLKPLLIASAMLTLSACSGLAPVAQHSISVPNTPEKGPIRSQPLDDGSAYQVQGGPEDPDPRAYASGDLGGAAQLPYLEFHEVPLSALARAIVVEHSRLAVIMSGDLSVAVSFSGGPFSVEDGLNALENIVRDEGLSYRRVGNIVSISAGATGEEASSVGYTRVYRTSASAVAEALDSIYGQVNAQAVGRSVAVSGSESEVRQALDLIRNLDRDTVSSLPWSVVRVSAKVAADAEAALRALSDADDPLAVKSFSLEDSGMVLLVGHSQASVAEAVSVLKALDAGREPTVSKVLPVSDPASVEQALSKAFKAEQEAGQITFSSSASELVMRGTPQIVGDAQALAEKFAGGLEFVEIRAIVAETLRGSTVDRAVSLGVAGNGIDLDISQSLAGGSTVSVGSGDFSAALQWLDRDAQTRLLSTPRLSVVSGGTAELTVGSQVPIPGSEKENEDGTTSRSIEYRDAGVVLKVEPTVLSDGRVSVTLSQEISTAGTNALSGLDAPVFDQRRLTSDLVLEDGELVAAGGLDYQSSDEYQSAPFKVLGPGGSSTHRKLVVLLTADVKDGRARRNAVQDALSGLASLLFVEGRT